MEKNYYGNYVGIVVQNDDPEHRGRLKIFVPHLSSTIYEKWNQEAKDTDKNFVFPDKETNPDLDGILDTLKDVLPWAECAAPLFGGSASGRYNAFTREGSTSDSNAWEEDQKIDGSRPLQNYTGDNSYTDAFDASSTRKNLFANPYAHLYEPSNYSNLARGLFTIPNVGAHVWVFFTGGNPRFPVYFAVSHNKEDWNRIYAQSDDIYEVDNLGNKKISNELFTSTDYPDAYQNLGDNEKDAELDANAKTFRAKSVLNSNKHSFEFVDTDEHEILKMTHFSGSFKEFTNYANIELATNNDQKMVLNDQFLTVNKNQSIYVAKTQDIIIAEDAYRTIGLANNNQVQTVVDILKEIHQVKQLFDIKRIPYVGFGTSPLQSQSGSFALCPTCGGQPYTPATHTFQNYVSGNIIPSWNGIDDCELTLDPEFIIMFMQREDINAKLEEQLNEIARTSGTGGNNTGFYLGRRCASCQRIIRTSSNTGEIFAVPNGLSPSTQDGNWIVDNNKRQVANLIAAKTEELYNAEKLLGEGDEIIEIAKNKIENVGLVMNDMESIRIDPIGKLEFKGLYTAPEGTYPTYKASQLIEYVDVDDVPGGDYNLTVSNKFKLLVGSRGINIKTFGPLDMYAPVINIAGQQVNVTSKGEVVIHGEERTVIKGRQIVLEPDESNSPGIDDNGQTISQPQGASVGVDGNLNVRGNTILNGGAFIEGELGILHVTAPFEWHLTELSKPIKTTTAIEYCSGGETFHVHYIMPHQHYFQNLPIDFYPAKEFVRYAMSNINTTNSTLMSAQELLITETEDTLSATELVFNNPWHQGSTNDYSLSGERNNL